MKQVLINDSVFFDQAVILENGILMDYIYEQRENGSVLGNIYKGKVMNILPGMQAAFVDIGMEKNAYLSLEDLLSDKFMKAKNIDKSHVNNIAAILKKGDEILVQVVREPMGEKGITVTTDISLSGKYVVFVPQSIGVNVSKKIKSSYERMRLVQVGNEIMKSENGMIMRTFASGCSKEEIEREYNILSTAFIQVEREYNYSYAPKLLYKCNPMIEKLFFDHIDSTVEEIYIQCKETKKMVEELIVRYNSSGTIKVIESNNAFEMLNVQKQLDALFERKIELDNGGSIFIDVTEAMTVIDVNSGKYVGSRNIEDTALEINLHALEEIGRQVRLRNISGIIIIDFIDMKNKEKVDLLIKKARSVFKKDKSKVNILGMTKLNLMELTRKKDKQNFFNIMSQECEHCGGSGKTSSKLYILMKIEIIVKKIKENTSCDAVILKTGEYLNAKIQYNCMDAVMKIEEKYNIKISFEKDSRIFSDEIIIDKMGKQK